MKKLLILINCLIILATLLSPVAFAEDDGNSIKTKNGCYDINAPQYETDIALLVNVDTDTVIYSKNANKVTAPASLAKLVTALVVLSECKNLQKEVTCSYDAIHSLDGTGSTIVGLKADEILTVESLLYCLLLPSANDAAQVLAEEFGDGNIAAFVDKMNALVEKLGCKNTYFANAHGLDDDSVVGFDSKTQSRTTASDMYLIAKECLKYDTIVEMTKIYCETIPETNKSSKRNIYNTNPLTNRYSVYYYEPSVGLKTGITDKAGACLVSSATKDGYTYISIAMKGVLDYSDGAKFYNSSYLMCRYMLRWAFSNIRMKVVADPSLIMGEVGVKYGRGADYVGLVPDKNVAVVLHKSLNTEDLELSLPEDFPKKVSSPIEKGDVVGKGQLMYKDIVVADVNLVAYQTIKKNYLWAAFNWIEAIATSKVFLVVVVVVIVVLVVFFLATRNQRNRKKRRKNSVDIVKDYSKLGK